ncbi:MAG: hypothetical protein KDC95_04340 [Planctomycetes bacterium]|nr:hypothetical protein [Planctomycetota bacterium]
MYRRALLTVFLTTLTVVVALAPSVPSQQLYEVVEISDLSGSKAQLINELGDIVGTDGELFVYDPRTSTKLRIGTPSWSNSFRAGAINDRGQIVGEAGQEFALWNRDGSWTQLGRVYTQLPPAGQAAGINNLGRVVGLMVGPTSGEAFSWTAQGGIVSLTPGIDGRLGGITDGGQGFGRRNNAWQYFDGAWYALTFEPLAIGAKGLVAGRSLANDALILYRHGVNTRSLRTPNAPNTGYFPYGVNETGTIVGMWNYRLNSSFRQGAFLCNPSRGYLDGAALDTLVTPGWHVEGLFDINEKGQIVGVGYSNANTLRRAIRLDPIGHVQAEASLYGHGCYRSFASFAETFTSFDLQNKTLRMTPAAGGYDISAGSNTWHTPTSNNLALTIRSITGPLSLPFTFRFPGGSTSVVRLCSQGYLWLDGTTATIDRNPDAAKLVAGAARLCPFWFDFYWGYPQDGTFHFDVDAPNGAAYFTWNNVLAENTRVDVQCALFATGVVEFRYKRAFTSMASWHRVVVGFRPGGGELLPPPVDISRDLPFQTRPTQLGLTCTPTVPPIVGAQYEVSVGGLPRVPSAGLMWLGANAFRSGIDLAAIGAAGCGLFASPDAFVTWQSNQRPALWSIALPASQSLVGARVYQQAAAFAPAANVAGLITSNAIELRLGN